MRIRKSIIKLFLFFMPLLSLVFFLNQISDKGSNLPEVSQKLLKDLEAPADTSCFFIGSSRVQRGLNPEIIQSHYDHISVYNLGISGATFLSNAVLADYLIRTKGHKTLFIELSPMLGQLPKGLLSFSSEAGFDPFKTMLKLVENQSFSEQFLLTSNIINHHVFYTTSLKEPIKNIARYNVRENESVLIGFSPSDENYFPYTSSLIKYAEIENAPRYSNVLDEYRNIVNYLDALGKQHDARIVLFLSLTYIKQAEKDIVIPLYHSLPDHMKLTFSEDFINEMTNEIYLQDKNHFNSKGAAAYSKMLAPLLRDFF